ncbi:MAG: hypothetical protein M3178_07435 [Pseudomonadota bacterium]|nr:hypothetical protein [Pseudomonadota bacterium]
MANAGSSGDVAKAIGDPLATLAGLLAGFVPEGPARTAVLVVEGLCAALAPFIYKYYLGVLAQGAQPEGSDERQDYDALRASLAGGNLAARLYAKWLTASLDGIERFFGDAGMADRTLFPRAFGLKKPAPLWTAPAFDRCLLLALIYPIATIFVIWAISGHVGPAEAALGLKSDISDRRRAIAAAAVGFEMFAVWWSLRPSAQSPILAFAVVVAVLVAVTVAVAFAFGGAAAGAGAFTGAVIVAAAVAVAFAGGFGGAGFVTGAVAFGAPGAVAGAVAVAFAFGAPGLSAVAFGAPGAIAIAIAVAVIVVVAVALLSDLARKYRWEGAFLSLFLPAMILACLGLVVVVAPLEEWGDAGPLLLFLGLLTLLNAPFDWASLGLTRALLRRGLELGGWWPYLLALVDAALAGVIVALLALTMVIGVQAFDDLAVHGGGKPVLPLDTLFDGIAKNPSAPEYLVGLCAIALVHDPEPHKSRHRRHGLHAWDSVAGAASVAMDARGQSRAGI